MKGKPLADEQYDDGWGLSEGTVLGEGVVTIDSAEFGFDASYGNGEIPLAIFEGNVVSDDGEAHDWRKLYSVGKGWDVVDQGARIQREDGRPKGVGKQSKYGLWIAGAMEAGAAEVLRGRGKQTEAKVWEGLTFEVRAKETDYGGEIGKKQTLVPVRFVGEGSAKTATGSAPAAQSAATTAAPTATAQASGLSASLKAKLKKLAKECESHDEFVDRAFVEVDGVDGNGEAETLVADSADFYNELRG